MPDLNLDLATLERPNAFVVDIAAIEHNVAEVRRAAGAHTQVFGAVKANGYGFGVDRVAQTLLSTGADGLAMVDVPDAIRLRRQGINSPILIYAGNPVTPDLVRAVEEHQLLATVVDDMSAKQLASLATKRVDVFVKVDVGLERNGIAPEETVSLIRSMNRSPKISVTGLYTHMHVVSRDGVEQYVAWQYSRFTSVVAELKRESLSLPIYMAASSSVIRLSNEMNLNAVDPGSLLYGLVQPGVERVGLALRPAFRSLSSRLAQAKRISRTEFVDWAPFDPAGVERIGVIPLGRADGMVRVNCGEVLVRGRRVRILGTPAIEHTRIDLTGVPDATVGDEVVIIGRQGKGEITQDEVIARQQMERQAWLALEIRESIPRIYDYTDAS